MHKTDMVRRMMNKGYTHDDATRIIDEFTNTVTEILAEGQEIRLQGFGTFSVKEVEEHLTSCFDNPASVVPAHRRIKFTPHGFMKRAVNAGYIPE